MASDNAVQVPRLVVAGDVIIPKGRETGEIVRGVDVVIHLADGTDHVYSDDDQVEMAPPSYEPPSLKDIKDAHKREMEKADAAIEAAKERLADLHERRSTLDDLIAQIDEQEAQVAAKEAELASRQAHIDRISEEAAATGGQ